MQRQDMMTFELVSMYQAQNRNEKKNHTYVGMCTKNVCVCNRVSNNKTRSSTGKNTVTFLGACTTTRKKMSLH